MEIIVKNNCPEYFYGIFFRNISRKNILKKCVESGQLCTLAPLSATKSSTYLYLVGVDCLVDVPLTILIPHNQCPCLV